MISSDKNLNIQSSKAQKENQSKTVIELSEVEKKWSDIIQSINKLNSKTAIFLENVVFDKIEENKLFLLVSGVNEFSIKSLEKDKDIIENTINEVLNVKLSLMLNYKKDPENEKNKKKIEKLNETDEDHPLFMNALEKFKGKIIN